MATLLSLLLPGLGHLAIRRYGVGFALVLAWGVIAVSLVVAASFTPIALGTLAGAHLLLAGGAWLHLRRLRKRGVASTAGAGRSIAAVVLAAALVGSLGLGTTSFLVRPVAIRSGSMEPGIWTGDVVVAQLFWPWIGRVTLGDVVLVGHPGRRGRLLLKRIIGMAGDVIAVRRGELYRNGRPLAQCVLRQIRDPESRQPVVERLEVLDDRPYLVWDQPAVESRALSVRVPPGHLFVLGDNRDRSGDSRSFGPVPVSLVRARIRVGLAPLRGRVDHAPLSARRAAFARCSGGRGSRR